MFARLIFAVVDFRARRGVADLPVRVANAPSDPSAPAVIESPSKISAKERARRTGDCGETCAYGYLRSRGYVMVARNFMTPGIKGEIDMAGYDGQVLAFVEVKTRSTSARGQSTPEETVTADKRNVLSRTAQQFLRAHHVESSNCRFDMVAIETRPGAKPVVRLHKGAFARQTT